MKLVLVVALLHAPAHVDAFAAATRTAPQLRPARSIARVPAASAVVPGATAWYGGHAAALGLYLANWVAGAKLMPRGVPQRELIDKEENPALLKTFIACALLELLVVYVLPWPAMALEGGRWRLGVKLFSPCMVMTVINIALEGYYRRQRLITLTYANTGASGLWRMLSYCAVLSAVGGTAPWFRAVAAAGVAVHVFFICLFTCLIAAGLPLRGEEASVLTYKDMGIPGVGADAEEEEAAQAST